MRTIGAGSVMALIICTSVFAQTGDSSDKDAKVNSMLGKVELKNHLSKCLDVSVEPWKMADPIPTDYQLPIKVHSKKLLAECGCKYPEYEAQFLLSNKVNLVVKSDSWNVGTPDGPLPSYTMNVSTSFKNQMSPPLKLTVCCSSARTCK